MSDRSVEAVIMPSALYRRIREASRAGLPNEACGYLSGSADPLVIEDAHGMTNIDASPEHYSFDPAEQFALLEKVAAVGHVLVGNWHSHPSTPARMSEEDLRLAHDPAALYAIYSVRDDELGMFRVVRDERGIRRAVRLPMVIEGEQP